MYSMTGLINAIESNNINNIKELIKAGADINAQNERFGLTALSYAIINKPNANIDIVKLLLASGANTNIKGNFGTTPLLFAVSNCDKEIVELLLAYNANINHTDDKQMSVFHGVQNHEACQILINQVINDFDQATLIDMINAQDIWERTPLHKAAQGGYKEIAELLLAQGADKSIKIEQGPYKDKTASDMAGTAEIKESINNYMQLIKR